MIFGFSKLTPDVRSKNSENKVLKFEASNLDCPPKFSASQAVQNLRGCKRIGRMRGGHVNEMLTIINMPVNVNH